MSGFAGEMDEELYQQFVEEFNSSYDVFMDNVQKIIHSKNPEKELRMIREVVHNMNLTTSMLGINNLNEFFAAFEKVLNKVKLGPNKKISKTFDQALGIGFFKFQEIARTIDQKKDLSQIEVLVDVENLYSIADNL